MAHSYIHIWLIHITHSDLSLYIFWLVSLNKQQNGPEYLYWGSDCKYTKFEWSLYCFDSHYHCHNFYINIIMTTAIIIILTTTIIITIVTTINIFTITITINIVITIIILPVINTNFYHHYHYQYIITINITNNMIITIIILLSIPLSSLSLTLSSSL